MSQPVRKITFSWEKKPGVSKVTSTHHGENLIPKEEEFLAKLPPPPCTPEESATTHHKNHPLLDFQIPLPPCAFQPPNYETFSKMQDGDPFFAAYKKCTKSTKSVDRNSKLQINTSMETTQTRLRNSISMSFISCKRSCAVRDNNLVRVSRLPQNVDEG